MVYLNNDRMKRTLPNKKMHESTNRGQVKHRKTQRDHDLKRLLKPQHEPMK
jgi:hypothetical protein